MFDHTHYVPILRWKQAEWLALRNLLPTDKPLLTPLIEITPTSVAPRKRYPTIDEMLTKNAADVIKNWGERPVFVDLRHLPRSLRTTSGSHPLVFVGDEARTRGVSLIPVTGLHRDSHYQAAVSSATRYDRRGVCIRLFRNDINRPDLSACLQQLLTFLSVDFEQVDLLVDFEITDHASFNYRDLCRRLPSLHRWRTFIVASGSFPVDLQQFTVGQHLLPRLEWQNWRALVLGSNDLPRRPTFSDYTIQHPIYREPPARSNPSASIRYAISDDWIIMRGEGIYHKGSPGLQQWPAHAQLLCARPEFCGSNFSHGDYYIHHMSLQTTKTGIPETWLRAGFNHHLTFAARQVATLCGVPTPARVSAATSPGQ